MNWKTRLRWTLVASILGFLSFGVHSCNQYGYGSLFFFFRSPLFLQLSLIEGVEMDLHLSGLVDETTLQVKLDGVPVDPAGITIVPGGGPLGLNRSAQSVLPTVEEGSHQIEAHVDLDLIAFRIPLHAITWFDTADLERPDDCEILNDAQCLLPFPSSRFLEEVGLETETGFRAHFPEFTIDGLIGPPISPVPLNVYDGFAPTTQILVHLEGVDPEASGAARLLPPGVPQSPPYVGVRTHDDSSLDFGSPTVLLDVDTGERVMHWVEVDHAPEALADPSRQVLYLRPAHALVPGHRYIAAFRRMKDSDGEILAAERTFRALRDHLPTTIDSLEARRAHFEDIFHELQRAGVVRYGLQLAFDFRVRSEKQLHERMLAMRDDALEWLDNVPEGDLSGFDNVTFETYGDCSDPAQEFWRKASGTFDGPYYMNGDINNPFALSVMNVDANRMPVRNGTFPFNWSVAVPCTVFRGEEEGHPLLLGHGFLGDGAGMVNGFVGGGFFGGSPPVSYIAGATDWRGLALGFSGPDALGLVINVLGIPSSGHKFNNFPALPDRLKQGMVNTLVLSRMMKSGFFNRLPVFQRQLFNPETGVFTPDKEMFYFGVSLGGIYGTMYAALNGDTIRHNVDVPAMNFSILEQRSTQFPVFLDLIKALGLTDPMSLAVLLQIQHEMWVSAEPAAYIRNVTGLVDPPLPGSPPKKMLVTVAFLDKQVSNQATNIFTRSMGIPHLEGSIQEALPGIPDVSAEADAPGPGLDSAMQIYDVGYFDIYDPAHEPFLPALANLIPSSKCDPHGGVRLSVPASIDQLRTFLQPGGEIFNFCDGACDAQTPEEQPSAACDPLE